mmetsp:Transcript_5535/g.10173  ORF Transcript_5535/g.10173 Transcript_5535/m.10173 type:complete len:107 (-) Transcript_5535:166-486(-)
MTDITHNDNKPKPEPEPEAEAAPKPKPKPKGKILARMWRIFRCVHEFDRENYDAKIPLSALDSYTYGSRQHRNIQNTCYSGAGVCYRLDRLNFSSDQIESQQVVLY